MSLFYHYLIPCILILIFSFWLGQVPYDTEHQASHLVITLALLSSSLWVMYTDAKRVGCRVGSVISVISLIVNPIGWMAYAIKSRGWGFWRVAGCYIIGLACHVGMISLGHIYAFGQPYGW